jgi:hypothetical protein
MAYLLTFAYALAVANAHDASVSSWPADFINVPSTAAGGPEQFWLALGADPAAVTVSWITANADASTVKFGIGALTESATGTSSTYSTLGYTSGYIHIATLAGLTAGATYSYQVGGAAQSAIMTFNAPRGVGAIYPFKIASIGDLGQTTFSNDTIHHVIASKADVAHITGDLSYADGDQTRWDSFQRLMTPLSSTMAVMVCPGNRASMLADSARGAPPFPSLTLTPCPSPLLPMRRRDGALLHRL